MRACVYACVCEEERRAEFLQATCAAVFPYEANQPFFLDARLGHLFGSVRSPLSPLMLASLVSWFRMSCLFTSVFIKFSIEA